VPFEPKEPQKEIKYSEMRIYTDEELNNYTEEELKNFKIKHDIPDLEELEKVRGPALCPTPSKVPCTEGNWPTTEC